MTNWKPAGRTNLPAEQQQLLTEVNNALGALSKDRSLDGPVLVGAGTDGHIRLIFGAGAPDPDDERGLTELAKTVMSALTEAGLRLTADPAALAEGYYVRVARRAGRPEVGKPVMIRFPEDMLAQVDARAAEAGTSRAAVIRDLVSAGLRDKPTDH